MNIEEERLYREIGQRLRAHRRRLQRKQGEVAEGLGILRSSLANIESGKQRITVHTLYRICVELNLPIVDVLPSVNDFVTEVPVSAISLDSLPEQAQSVLAQLDLRFAEESDEGDGDDQPSEGSRP